MDKHDKNETITDVEMLLNEGNTHCGENLQQQLSQPLDRNSRGESLHNDKDMVTYDKQLNYIEKFQAVVNSDEEVE